jgi:hypothetical protein
MRIELGNVAEWFAAVGGVGALLFLWANIRLQGSEILKQEKYKNNIESKKRSDLEREHASKISFWVESGLKNPKIHIKNASNLPIINTIMSLYTNEGALEVVSGSNNLAYGFKYIPSGDYSQSLKESSYDLSKEVLLIFTDSKGIEWQRVSDGSLKKSKLSEQQKIEQWKARPSG